MQSSRKKYSHDRILGKVNRAIQAHGMLDPGDAVLVGVSGGADSVALLHLLLHLKPVLNLDIAVAHLNHNLRGKASDADARFVAGLAQELGLSLFIKKIDVLGYKKKWGLSLEETSRKIRYDYFSKLIHDHPYDKVALGHHMDDNAELVLMNLFRGSGTMGVSGIPPARDNQIIRPLCNLCRHEIDAFLSENRIHHIIDESNQDTSFLRNRIRHTLLPLLKEQYNPNIITGIHQFTEIIRTEEAWLDRSALSCYKTCLIEQNNRSIILSVGKLKRLHLAMQRRVLRKAIKSVRGNLRRITFTHMEDAVKLLNSDNPSAGINLPGNTKVYRSYETLIVSLREERIKNQPSKYGKRKKAIGFSYEIARPHHTQTTVDIVEIGTRLICYELDKKDIPDFYGSGHQRVFLDMAQLTFPLLVRNIEPGDRFSPLGLSGTQKIKSFFINNKTPRSQRIGTPVVVSDGRIIWLVGLRIDESVKITDGTTRVLCTEFSLINN